MEEETIKAIEDPLYWTTYEIKNCDIPLSVEKWVPKSQYDALQEELKTLRDEYNLAEKDFYDFKSAVKIILRHYN